MGHINQLARDPSIKRHVHCVCINIELRINRCSLEIKISFKLQQTEAKLWANRGQIWPKFDQNF